MRLSREQKGEPPLRKRHKYIYKVVVVISKGSADILNARSSQKKIKRNHLRMFRAKLL